MLALDRLDRFGVASARGLGQRQLGDVAAVEVRDHFAVGRAAGEHGDQLNVVDRALELGQLAVGGRAQLDQQAP